ncbi:nuclear transport factor 2 family protein [Chitinophaga qingshengii]|uniref:Nuclear transport factor 2 family protein n=1 Tax=Chitinophaga qingshengii TaxID=1569794 RepID=A0ABR7TEW8_9BACT|nr:nuclear transport factor 2 family protein [Chitinophaga qingshengii]MBC9928774.1 nuclear transport factor 2 family protein [Chitinophaga qingshengii]
MESQVASTQAVVEKYLGNISAKNYQANLDLLADQVEWRIPGNQAMAPWIRDRNTKEEVVLFYEELFRHVEPISYAFTGKFYAGDQAVLTGNLESRMLATGKVFYSPFTIQITVRDGRINRYLLLEDSFGLVKTLTA